MAQIAVLPQGSEREQERGFGMLSFELNDIDRKLGRVLIGDYIDKKSLESVPQRLNIC